MGCAFRSFSVLSQYFRINTIHLRRLSKLKSEKFIPLSEETLIGRILIYLNPDQEKDSTFAKSQTDFFNNVFKNKQHLQTLNTDEILQFSKGLARQRFLSRSKTLSLVENLDAECLLRSADLSCEEIFRLFNIYMKIIPNRITEMDFYKSGLQILFSQIKSLEKKDLLQFTFYAGLNKKNLNSQRMLRQSLKLMDKQFIDSLTVEEMCVICSSTFKTSTKIKNKLFLSKVREYLKENLFILKDTAIFITFIKSIRHNRFQDDNLLSTLSCAVLFNKTYENYSFPTNCHLMAAFADYFYYDEGLFKLLTKKCIEQLDKSTFEGGSVYVKEKLRAKDIKRFLWVMGMFSELKLIDNCDVKNVIIPKLIERLKRGEFKHDPDSLIEIFFYLWMISAKPYELVPHLRQPSSKSLANMKLNLLLHCIKVEDPELFKQILLKPAIVPPYSSDYQLQKRPFLKRLLINLKVIKDKLGLSSIEISLSVPCLNYLGITGYKNGKEVLYIEVVDEYTRLKNLEDVPVGLNALKIRLLNKSDQGLLVISEMETEGMSDEELREFLMEEINLIC